MTKAFIINLNTGSDTDFITLASEIQDALEKDGMLVISVQPWASPTQQPTITPPPPTIL